MKWTKRPTEDGVYWACMDFMGQPCNAEIVWVCLTDKYMEKGVYRQAVHSVPIPVEEWHCFMGPLEMKTPSPEDICDDR